MSVCNDLVHSLCSPHRVKSFCEDTVSATYDSLLRVEAWSRAVSAALEKLNSEQYSSFVDVLCPFSTGLQLVRADITLFMWCFCCYCGEGSEGDCKL